jgi:hypothetical protein
MKTHPWGAACMQETWTLGISTFTIDGYTAIMHGQTNRSKDDRGRNKAGDCILLLSPLFMKAYEQAKQHTVTIPIDHKFEGHLLGIVLTFPNYDDKNDGKQIKGHLKLFLCSISRLQITGLKK